MEKNLCKKSEIKDKLNQLNDFRFIIDEAYDENLGLEKLVFNVSDKLVDSRLFFESIQDIEFDDEKYGDLHFFIGILFRDIPGLIYIVVERYKISFYKSPVFYWYELEEKIIPILKEIIVKERNFYFLGRNSISILFDSYNNVVYVKNKIN